MAFDPALPANNSPISSAELRSQFTGLADLIAPAMTAEGVQQAIAAQSAGPVTSMPDETIEISDPPTAAQVQYLQQRLNVLIALLKRAG